MRLRRESRGLHRSGWRLFTWDGSRNGIYPDYGVWATGTAFEADTTSLVEGEFKTKRGNAIAAPQTTKDNEDNHRMLGVCTMTGDGSQHFRFFFTLRRYTASSFLYDFMTTFYSIMSNFYMSVHLKPHRSLVTPHVWATALTHPPLSRHMASCLSRQGAWINTPTSAST
jgi:hypothetical protein